jgi:hypothetical protein
MSSVLREPGMWQALAYREASCTWPDACQPASGLFFLAAGRQTRRALLNNVIIENYDDLFF